MKHAEDMGRAYSRYFPLLRGKCRRMLRTAAEAEDVAQETFVKLLQSGLLSRLAFADDRQIAAWLYKTSTHLAVDRLRRRRFHEGVEPSETQFAGGQEAALSARQLVLRLTATAEAEVLEAVILCRIDGLGQDEAARILGCSQRTLRRRLERFDQQAETIVEAL